MVSNGWWITPMLCPCLPILFSWLAVQFLLPRVLKRYEVFLNREGIVADQDVYRHWRPVKENQAWELSLCDFSLVRSGLSFHLPPPCTREFPSAITMKKVLCWVGQQSLQKATNWKKRPNLRGRPASCPFGISGRKMSCVRSLPRRSSTFRWGESFFLPMWNKKFRLTRY